MPEDDDRPNYIRPGQRRWLEPLTLDMLGLEELAAYVVELRGEIARVEADMARKTSHRGAAEAFFRKPGG